MVETNPVFRSSRGTPEQQGLMVYMQLCVTCHGPDRARITYPKEIGGDQLKITVRGGKGEMPAFTENTLPAANLDALMAYLTNAAAGSAPMVGRGGGAARPFTPVPGPPPPPKGQTRYYGPFGNVFTAGNGLIAMSPPWSELVAYDLNE